MRFEVTQTSSVLDGANRQNRDDGVRVLQSLGGQVVSAPGTLQERQTEGNAFFMLAGLHGGFALQRSASVVQGAPGAQVFRKALFDASAVVTGVTFLDGVELSATARVVFQNCRFLVPIEVASGGRVRCMGCLFDGTSAITNAGAVANASRIGCDGDSALAADLNITIIGGV